MPSAETINNEQQAAELFKEHWLPELSRTAAQLFPSLLCLEPHNSKSLHSGQTSTDNDPRLVKRHQATLADGLAITVLEIDASRAAGRAGSSEPSVEMVHLGELDELATDAESLVGFANNADSRACWPSDRVPSTTSFARNADWQQADLTVKQETQIVRRFYLLGQMPEQRDLADGLSSLQLIKRLARRDGEQPVAVTLTGAGRSAAIATLAGLMCAANASPELPSVAELRVSQYPTDPELAPALPGLLRVCDYASLLAAARGSFQVVENNESGESGDEALAKQRLVDSSSEPQQACGFKIVEVRQDLARVWVRATRWAAAEPR
ncbi:MAG: hypothetical protein R3C56_00140 [Pirellulaceae bacterium]